MLATQWWRDRLARFENQAHSISLIATLERLSSDMIFQYGRLSAHYYTTSMTSVVGWIFRRWFSYAWLAIPPTRFHARCVVFVPMH